MSPSQLLMWYSLRFLHAHFHLRANNSFTSGNRVMNIIPYSFMQSYSASVENIYAIESSACPYDEIKKLPNKVLLWCGRH